MAMMYAETHRLSSFSGWPGGEEAAARRFERAMANSGFYATGNPGSIKCYFCGLVITNLDLGRVLDITSTHRELNPDCPFILHPECTDNVRIFDRDELKDEQLRLSTFVHWPVTFISRQELAKSGFYYTHHSDEVQCAWCSGVIGRWEVGDDPFAEHEKFFPSCQKVIENAIRSDPIPDASIGIQPVQMPHMPEYSTLDSRIRSFETWTIGNVQDPARLAQAGFYYLGISDEVRCFHCDGGLRFWLADDDPWVEHARCFPKCQFVQLVKGQLFIENVQTQFKQSSTNAQQGHSMQTVTRDSYVSHEALEEALRTEPVQMALQMGLNVGRITAAILRRLSTVGQLFQTTNDLVEAVLDVQIEEENLEPTTSSHMGSRMENMLMQIATPLDDLQQQTNVRPASTHLVLVQQPISVPDGPAPSLHKETDKSNTKSEESVGASSVPESHASKVLSEEATIRLREENKRLKDARECKICMSEEVGVVFCPCGHLVSCVQCAPAVVKCPLCRAVIKGRVRTFLS